MNILTREFSDHLTILPSVAGLHVAALARSATSLENDSQ